MKVPAAARKGLAYVLKGGLYLSLTNFAPCTTLVASRGPGFQMPSNSGFEPLPNGDENLPQPAELAEIIDEVYRDLEIVGMGENDPGVSFTGLGDPLLRLETVLETVALVKERRHGVAFSVTTSGLFDADVPAQLRAGGVKQVCVALNAASPAAYEKIMAPTNGKTFNDVCNFVVSAAEAGMDVTCAAVETPGVKLNEVRQLATSLGATTFKTRPYFQ